jgi:hypothetical protein
MMASAIIFVGQARKDRFLSNILNMVAKQSPFPSWFLRLALGLADSIETAHFFSGTVPVLAVNHVHRMLVMLLPIFNEYLNLEYPE